MTEAVCAPETGSAGTGRGELQRARGWLNVAIALGDAAARQRRAEVERRLGTGGGGPDPSFRTVQHLAEGVRALAAINRAQGRRKAALIRMREATVITRRRVRRAGRRRAGYSRKRPC